MNQSDWNWKAVPDDLIERLSLEQAEMARMLKSGMTTRRIARDKACSERAAFTLLRRTKLALQALGFDPVNGMTLVSPDLQTLKGRSALVKVDPETGEERVVQYWNKTDTKADAQQQAFAAAIQELSNGIKPFKTVKPKERHVKDHLTVYTLTDFHLGMYSWSDETGASWDMKIAENVLLNAFSEMVAGSPDSEVGIFAQLGDLLHWDGLLALTPTAKNVLDADTRFPLLVQTAISVCLKAVEMLLHKHAQVHVLMAEGNHDMASSVWLRAIMTHTFRDNKRVSVEGSPFPFYSYRWGKVFLGWHHGHLQKMDNLPLLFATDPKFKRDHGAADFTYIHTGHMHHQKVIDRGGVVVEQHPTLSARDAHGARGFLFSNREAKAITYHKEHGEKSRCTVRPNLKEFQGAA